MIKKLFLALALVLLAGPAVAQNVQCPTRPNSDSTNACASTAFVQNVLAATPYLPNTLTQNDLFVGNASNVAAGVAMSGDCTIVASGAITCTKTNGVAFGTFATQNYATPPAIGLTTPAAAKFTTLGLTGLSSGTCSTSLALDASNNVVTTACGTGYWTLSGTDIHNNNAGNVGVGVTSPAGKLDVRYTPTSAPMTLGGTPLVGTAMVVEGSSGTPSTSNDSTMLITRYEGTGTSPHGTLNVTTESTSTSISYNGVGIWNFMQGDATSVGDVIGIAATCQEQSTSGTSYSCYNIFGQANMISGLDNAIGEWEQVYNTTGNNGVFTLSTGTPIFGIGYAAAAQSNASNYNSGVGYLVTNPTGGAAFDVGFGVQTGTTARATFASPGFMVDPAGYVDFTYNGSSATNLCVSVITTPYSGSLATLQSCSSDRRLKHDIKPLRDNALLDIMKLRPVNFVLNSDKTNRVDAGFIAQEVQPVVPEAVLPPGKDGMLGFQTGPILSYTVRALQEVTWLIATLFMLYLVLGLFVARLYRRRSA